MPSLRNPVHGRTTAAYDVRLLSHVFRKFVEDRMMRQILLVIDHLGVGGVQEYFLNIVRAGHGVAKFTVISLFANDVYGDRFRLAGAEVVVCSERAYSLANVLRLSGLAKYRRYLRENARRYHRIHVRLFAAFLYSSLIGLFRQKGVSAGLDAGRRQLPWFVLPVFLIFARKYETFFIPQAYWIEYGMLRLRSEQLRPVGYLVTDRSHARPVPLEHNFNIVAIGRCLRQKGLTETVDLFTCMAHLTHEDIGLYIIGDGPDRPELERKIATTRMQNIHCLGTIVDLDPYMAAAGMVIKMAIGEGINSVVREALLAEKIVATTVETAECQEFVDEGLLIPIDRDDIQGAAQRLVAIIEGRNQIDRVRAADRIRSSVDPSQIIEALS